MECKNLDLYFFILFFLVYTLIINENLKWLNYKWTPSIYKNIK